MSLGDSFGSSAVRACSFLGGALVIGFVGAALFGGDGVARHERLREDLRQVQALNAELGKENKRLLLESQALKNDPAFLESVIRDELGWVRGDELVFIFPSERAP